MPVIAFLLMLAFGCHGTSDGLLKTSGYIESTDVRISSKVGGTLARFDLREGDPIKAGTIIAQIDPVDIKLALDAAQAERVQAEADLESATRDAARMEKLFASGSAASKSRDDAETRKKVARAKADATRARVAQLDQQLSDTTIKSPLNGVLTHKLVEAGEIVAPGTALAVVTDLEDTWLNAYIAEPDLGRVKLGQTADIVLDSGTRRTGKITFISPQAEFTPKNVQTKDERVKLVFKIKITVENKDGLFKPGMPSETWIHVKEGA